jgi:hypothetical protein
MSYRKDWGQPQAGPEGFGGTGKCIGRVVNVSVADNVTGNTIGAFTVPKGFLVTGIIAVATDMDGGTAMLVNVGDAASATRYLSGLNTQAAITSTTVAATGLLFLNTVDTEILVTIGTQAGTAVAGTIALYLLGAIVQ